MLQVVEYIFDGEGIIAKIASKLSNAGQYRLHIFAIKFVRGCFTVAGVTVIVDLDNGIRCHCLQTPRNTEWRCELEIDRFCVNMHGVCAFFLRQGSNALDRSSSTKRSRPCVMLSAAKHLCA